VTHTVRAVETWQRCVSDHGDEARCQTIGSQARSDGGDAGNSAAIAVSNADHPDLREVGRPFVDVGWGRLAQPSAAAATPDAIEPSVTSRALPVLLTRRLTMDTTSSFVPLR